VAVTKTIAINGAADWDFGDVHPGFTGRFIIQVTAYSGLTNIIPKLSADGITFVVRAITPFDNSADVATIVGVGGWVMDALGGKGRLTSVGAGTATVLISPAIG
jgi:hypothetical protein